MPIQLDFILRRLVDMAEADPELRVRQPWQAAYEHDYAWLNAVIQAHYAGDDHELKTSPVVSWPRTTGSASTSSRPVPRPSCGPRHIPPSS